MPRCVKVLWLGSIAFGVAAAQAAHTCDDVPAFQAMGVTLQIAKATPVAATAAVPAFCRVEGVIDPRTGVEGKSYGIGFALALPDSWNGRFLFQGGGGLNGTVGNLLMTAAAGDTPGAGAWLRCGGHR